MRRNRILVATIAAAATVGFVAVAVPATAASPLHQTSAARSPLQFVGHRGPLTATTTAGTRSASAVRASTNVPSPGTEIKGEAGNDEAGPQGGAAVNSGTVAPPTAKNIDAVRSQEGVIASFQGSNHFDSRYSGFGNQFSGEPPDQGMCVSNTNVFEIVNQVVQVYDRSGTPLIAGNKAFPSGPSVGLTLNEFFGQAPSIDRTTGVYGPFIFDTSCLYDASTNRWFVTSAALDQDPSTGDYTGDGGVFVAVSQTSNPFGSWNIWTIDTANNGQNGTPDHQCDGGYCFGDYPQIGLDGNGFYVTTNEFSLFGDAYDGAQLYALSKADLVAGAASPTMQTFQNVPTSTYNDLTYSMQPVNALPADWSTENHGTMYFGMSGSGYTDGLATSIVLFSLSNSASLNSSHPNLQLAESAATTEPYAVPGYAKQKDGPMPLLACINNPSCIGAKLPKIRAPGVLDAGNAGKVTGAWLHNGNVYLVAGTPLKGTGAATYDDSNGSWASLQQHTGVAWFIVKPSSAGASLVNNGYVAVKGNNLTFPTIAVSSNGSGAIGATLVGPDWFPSAAVARFAGTRSPARVQVPAAGVGPNDGFTMTAVGGYRPRWGDYGQAAVAPDGSIWLASEYIAQRCSNATFNADPTCGFTRSFYANWSTRITAVMPKP
jgi:hypothetical protein